MDQFLPYQNDAPVVEDAKEYEQRTKGTRQVLQLSSLKIYAPSEGFSMLREIYLSRSGATDNDLEKIAKICAGITVLDCSSCPRIGDIGISYLVPRAMKVRKGGGFETEMVGCPCLKKIFLYDTSVTNLGIRNILASKLISTLKVIGVSSHITSDIIAELKKRKIECPGTASSSNQNNNNGALAVFGGLGDSVNALFEPVPKFWDDLTELLKFTTCWPSENKH